MKIYFLEFLLGVYCFVMPSPAFSRDTSLLSCSKLFGPSSSDVLQNTITTNQIDIVVRAVRETFPILRKNPKFLPKMWASQNAKSQVDSEGFCFAATNAVYHMLGGKAAGLTPMVAKYFDADVLKDDPESQGLATHWWLRTQEGTFIDPTIDQYTAYGKEPPYDLGKGAGFNRPLTTPTKAGKTIIDLATEILRQHGLGQNGLPI